MNLFGLGNLNHSSADTQCAVEAWVLIWLADDVASVPTEQASAALDALHDFYFHDYWCRLNYEAAVIDALFLDVCAVALVRLQTLVGSLGPDVDEQIFQWLHQA